MPQGKPMHGCRPCDYDLCQHCRDGMQLIEYAEQPRLLGVTYDEAFSFAPHTTELREKLQKRGGVVGALTGTTWGCRKKTLRATYITYVRSKIDTCPSAWQPFCSYAVIAHSDTAQRCLSVYA